jgi:hypothetical protein
VEVNESTLQAAQQAQRAGANKQETKAIELRMRVYAP